MTDMTICDIAQTVEEKRKTWKAEIRQPDLSTGRTRARIDFFAAVVCARGQRTGGHRPPKFVNVPGDFQFASCFVITVHKIK